ncbi:hypothetical protein DR864_22635 [Runella rosea]|uniref:Uncharacterized protein n=1 Tax=Runella rosea TaxID=2259595 RepID=A0A344TNW9_9BACT|nr:hypothetical protein [Runella rosea]AXE20340.1 hypothetical protein DR864_22635 [Runella rosea]
MNNFLKFIQVRWGMLLILGMCWQNIFAQSVVISPTKSTFSQNSNSDSVVIQGKSSVPLTLKTDQNFIMLPLHTQNSTFVGGLVGQDKLLRIWGYDGLEFQLDDISAAHFEFGRFFVGEYGTAKAALDVEGTNGVGTIRSRELDFEQVADNERRPVFADKDGILRVSTTSNYYQSYNFSSVQAQDWDDQLRKGSGYAWFNTTTSPKTMYLPLNLPDGVVITNVRMYVWDNSASHISFVLNKNTHTTNAFTSVASAKSNFNIASIGSISASINETVDNQTNSYYLNISSDGNWTGDTLKFHSLVITYQHR